RACGLGELCADRVELTLEVAALVREALVDLSYALGKPLPRFGLLPETPVLRLGLPRRAEGALDARALGQPPLVVVELRLRGAEGGREAVELPFEPHPLLAEHHLLVVQEGLGAAPEVGLLVERAALLDQGLVARVGRLDLGGAADERLGLGDLRGEGGDVGVELGAALLGAAEAVAEAVGLAGGGVEGGEALGEGGLFGAEPLALGRALGHEALGLGTFGPPARLVLQRRLQALDLVLVPLRAVAGVAVALPGGGGEAAVAVEPEDLAQDLLPLARLLARELVGAALEQEGRVDERVVVEPDAGVDDGLRGADALGGERAVLPALGVEDVEFEARLARLAGGRLVEGADDPVARPLEVEHELDLHVARADAEELRVRLPAVARLPGLAPDGPRHGVEERALALPVGAGEAGDAERLEVQRLRGRAVGEEVLETERYGNHRGKLKG